MQNSTFLVSLRPILLQKWKQPPPTELRSGSCEGLAVIWTRIVKLFCCGAHPKLVKTFFWDHLILTEKPPQSNSRLMKTWVKFVYCCLKLPKNPLPLRNPGYAPGVCMAHFHVIAPGQHNSFRRNVTVVASRWQHSVRFDRPEIWTSDLLIQGRTRYRSTNFSYNPTNTWTQLRITCSEFEPRANNLLTSSLTTT